MHGRARTACTRRAAPAARTRRPERRFYQPPSLVAWSPLDDGDRARSKGWSGQSNRSQQPSSSVASGFILFFPSSPHPLEVEL